VGEEGPGARFEVLDVLSARGDGVAVDRRTGDPLARKDGPRQELAFLDDDERRELLKIDLDLRIPVGVYVVSRLFERPCFRKELKLMGITQKHLDQYLEKPGMVCELPDSHLKKARSDITRIEIPSDDPAYEIRENKEELSRLTNDVLAGLIKNRIDLEGLVAKSKQTTLVL